ncbi:MAG: hypothetical protein ACK41D_00930 [Rubricoccaceae bacterium]
MRPLHILLGGLLLAALVLTLRLRAAPPEATLARALTPDAPTLDALDEPDVAAPAERTLRAPDAVPVPLGPAAQDSVFYGSKVVVAGEDVFVADIGDMRIKRFTLGGAWQNAIGRGEGDGPGELRVVIDFAVRGDTLIVTDHRARALSFFLRDGTFLRRLATEDGYFYFAAGERALFVLTPLPSRMLGLARRDGTGARWLGPLIARQEAGADYYGLVNADLAALPAMAAAAPPTAAASSAAGERFLYVPHEADRLYAFDAAGRLVRVAETVGRRGFPPPERGPDGLASAPTTAMGTSGVSWHGDALFVGAYVRGRRDEVTGEVVRRSAGFVDEYDRASLSYRHSYALPSPEVLRSAQVVAVGGGLRVYGTSGDGSGLLAFDLPAP